MSRTSVILAPAAWLLPAVAGAHFQLLYTPEAALSESAALPLALVFSHPFDNGYTMDMGEPEAFYVVSQLGEDFPPVTTDLMEYLEPIEWTGANNGSAYLANPPRRVTRSLGDYTFVLRPSPYYEAQEDKYIQQITKTVVNVGGVPGAWDQPLGLPVEIVPLDKPYANWVGGVFRAVVLADGEPVPHAEIEIEYLNHEPQIDQRRFDPLARVVRFQRVDDLAEIRFVSVLVGDAVIENHVCSHLPPFSCVGVCPAVPSSESPGLEIHDCRANFVGRVHDEGTVARNRFIEGLAAHQYESR